jgi:ectoine hydroxylase-related dioxygenase (phytanoyl-CoA dioxygenase family)
MVTTYAPYLAGDVLFWDRLLPHRALPNQTKRIRWTLVMWVRGRE